MYESFIDPKSHFWTVAASIDIIVRIFGNSNNRVANVGMSILDTQILSPWTEYCPQQTNVAHSRNKGLSKTTGLPSIVVTCLPE